VPNVNDVVVVEWELTSVGTDFHQMVVPHRRRRDLTLHRYFSLMVQRAGGYRFWCISFWWSGVQLSSYGTKWSVFFGDVGNFCGFDSNKSSRPGRYLIVTDSMSCLKALQTLKVAPRTHSLVYEIKWACWWLKKNGYEIHEMWFPSYVR
jgi:hypothetical protein